MTDRLTDPTEPRFSAEFSKFYQDKISSKPLMSKELYFTLLYRPYPSAMAKRLARGGRTKETIEQQSNEALDVMRDKGALVERTLRHFDPTLLGVRKEGDNLYWESGEFFGFLINGTWQRVRLPKGPAWTTLPTARLSFGGDKLEIRNARNPLRRRFVAMLDFKEYSSEVEPGTLGSLLYEDFEFIESQSFSILPRRQATAALTLQRDQLIASDDAVVTQIEAMDGAIDRAQNRCAPECHRS